jgi:hypothetical protein
MYQSWQYSDCHQSQEFDADGLEERYRNLTCMLTPTKGTPIEFRQKTITTKKFEQETLSRFDNYEKKRKEKLLLQKKQQMRSELDQYTLAPTTNDSRLHNISRNPLISRLDEILESRKVKIENKKRTFQSKADKEASECTFTPAINKR